MYLLEGNIGVGKSTFLQLLAKLCPTITLIQEPIAQWDSNIGGQQLLDNFYTDPKRWSYTLETLTMISRVKDHTTLNTTFKSMSIVERSVYSGHYCFALNGYNHGNFSALEWKIYSEWVDFLVHTICKPPRGFIYLRASTDICYKRMKQRARKGEESLSFEYMNNIGLLHEDFFIKKINIAPYLIPIPVLVIDANDDYVLNETLMQQHAQQIHDFLLHTEQQTTRNNFFSTTLI